MQCRCIPLWCQLSGKMISQWVDGHWLPHHIWWLQSQNISSFLLSEMQCTTHFPIFSFPIPISYFVVPTFSSEVSHHACQDVVSCPEEAVHGWSLQITTTEVITNWSWMLQGRKLFSFFYDRPQPWILIWKLGPTSVKVERASLLRYKKSISVTSAILISKVQPCPTSSWAFAGFECGRHWPYMEVLASKWLQLSLWVYPAGATERSGLSVML